MWCCLPLGMLVALVPWCEVYGFTGLSDNFLRQTLSSCSWPLELKSQGWDDESDMLSQEKLAGLPLKPLSSFPAMAELIENPLLNQEKRPVALDSREQGRPFSDLSMSLALAGSTYALSSAMLWLLFQYEWFQTWRYFWPLMGLVYASDGALVIFGRHTGQRLLPIFATAEGDERTTATTAVAMISAVAGMGLVIGGAYDAYMPVWMTGPNVFTAAGIGQDSAMILWILTAARAVQPSRATRQSAMGKNFWTCVVLLSELYILSDSAFEDLIAMVAST
jgi:hypothetical protein